MQVVFWDLHNVFQFLLSYSLLALALSFLYFFMSRVFIIMNSMFILFNKSIITYIKKKKFKNHGSSHYFFHLPYGIVSCRAELRSIISLKHPYEAHCKAFSIAGGSICLLDRSSWDSDPTLLCLVGERFILYYLCNGWRHLVVFTFSF